MSLHKPQSVSAYFLRLATQADQRSIRQLIREAKINPLDIKWDRFILAVNAEGEVIGCGQIKSHWDGSLELASIAVKAGWRRQGIAHALIHALLNKHSATLYLTCRASLETFYQSFGFQRLEPEEMSPYFRILHQLSRWLYSLSLFPEPILVMRRD